MFCLLYVVFVSYFCTFFPVHDKDLNFVILLLFVCKFEEQEIIRLLYSLNSDHYFLSFCFAFSQTMLCFCCNLFLQLMFPKVGFCQPFLLMESSILLLEYLNIVTDGNSS